MEYRGAFSLVLDVSAKRKNVSFSSIFSHFSPADVSRFNELQMRSLLANTAKCHILRLGAHCAPVLKL